MINRTPPHLLVSYALVFCLTPCSRMFWMSYLIQLSCNRVTLSQRVLPKSQSFPFPRSNLMLRGTLGQLTQCTVIPRHWVNSERQVSKQELIHHITVQVMHQWWSATSSRLKADSGICFPFVACGNDMYSRSLLSNCISQESPEEQNQQNVYIQKVLYYKDCLCNYGG